MSVYADDGAYVPAVAAASDGRLLVAYNQVTETGFEDPYFRESFDGGDSWQDAAAIHESNDRLLQVDVTFDGDNVAHATWRTDSEIWHSRQDQWPDTANPITTTAVLVFSPAIAAGPDGALHAVWAQEDNRIYHALSTDGGDNWSVGTAISEGATRSDWPDVAVDSGGDVHVVWEETIFDFDILDYRYEVHYRRGVTESLQINWSAPSTLLSPGIDNARRPAVQVQEDRVHVAYARRDANNEQYAYYTQQTAGAEWSPPVKVSGAPLIVNANVPYFLAPALTLCEDSIYIYFHGAVTENGKEVLLGVSNSNGWQTRDLVNIGDSRAIRPSAVCTDGRVHIVYEKVITPNSDHQVYYVFGNRHTSYLPVVRQFGQ